MSKSHYFVCVFLVVKLTLFDAILTFEELND